MTAIILQVVMYIEYFTLMKEQTVREIGIIVKLNKNFIEKQKRIKLKNFLQELISLRIIK